MSELDLRVAGIAIGAGVTSWLLVGAIRWYALERGMLDRPSDRSSHSRVTPRGGGAGLVLAAVMFCVVATPAATADWRMVLAAGSVLLAGMVGWIDDRGSLPVRHRFLAHVGSGALLLPLAIGPATSPAAMVLWSAVWIFVTVSAINVVNFMDGIDGLIGLQAVIFGLHLALLADPWSAGYAVGLAMASAAVGFLFWNWAPARIFLGDAGSYSLAVLGVVGGIEVWGAGEWPFTVVFLPLFPIFADAAATIALRARRREQLTTPHRSHLYQRLANEARWGHARVSLVYGIAAAAATVVPLNARPGAESKAGAYMLSTLLLGVLLHRHASAQAARPTA